MSCNFSMNSAVSFSLFQNSELSCSTELVVNSAISYSLFQNSELDLMEYICMQIAEFTLGDCYEVSRNNQRNSSFPSHLSTYVATPI
uniref:Uncharacterized protein n=1 Tax=Oryza brachyantha TaxID=4533 RepID=J3MGN8_ORYBR